MAGYQLTSGQMKAIREVVRHYRSLIMGEVRGMMRTQVQVSYYCKLDGDLAAATSSDYDASSAPTATASIWHSDQAGGLIDSTRNLTVVNRYDAEYTAGTFGYVMWMCGEWSFVGGCEPY